MAKIDISALAETLTLTGSQPGDFHTFVSASATSYSYLDSFGNLITLNGSGIVVDGSNIPTAGTITMVTIDLSNDSPAQPDITIIDLSFDATDLSYTTGSFARQVFWNTLLEGDTDVSSLNGEMVELVGDIIFWSASRLLGGDDTLIGDNVSGTELYGDIFEQNGGLVLGGADQISGSFGHAFGDGAEINDASLIGGDDQIVLTTPWSATSRVTVFGDVEDMVNRATVFGGNDILDLSQNTMSASTVRGDASFVSGTSIIHGGHDIIRGGNYTGASSSYVGDAFELSGNAAGYGGNDSIYGGDADDNIVGDFFYVFPAAFAVGGDDLLFGGAGDDTIYGDFNYTDTSIPVTGGNDMISGGIGDDLLVGNQGDDTLNGGAGADRLFGDEGEDWADYSDEVSAAGIRLDGVANFGSASGDTFDSIEHVLGSAHNDTIVGSSGANHLVGQDGDDQIYGGDDSDTLDGGAGDDTLYGQNGDDVFLGSAGGDIMNGGAGDDTVDYSAGTLGGGIRLDGLASWGVADSDNYIDVEHVVASDFVDVVVGSTGDNRIEARGGNDTVYALGGNDTIVGGAGDDVLFGQGGSDVFVFSDGFGNDTINGFAATDTNEDIDLSAVTEITDFTDLQTNHMSQVGSDVVIDDGFGNTITLSNTALASLDATDFVF